MGERAPGAVAPPEPPSRPSPEPTLLERLGEAGASASSLAAGRSRARRLAVGGLVALVVAFLVAALASQWSRLPDIAWRLEPGWLALSIAALIVFQAFHAQLWVMTLHALGSPVPGARGRMVWSVTLLARYVPANVALAVSRMAMAEREGVPKRVCMASLVYEMGFAFAGSAAVGAYFVIALPQLEGRPLRWLALALPVIALAALDPRVFRPLADAALRRLGRGALPRTIGRGRVLELTALFAVSFVVAGVAVYALGQALHGLAPADAPTAIGAYSVGFAASVVAFVIPGGLGARETGLVAALSGILPLTVAIAVAVAVRLLQMGVELLYAAVTPLLARRGGSVGDA